MSERPGDAVRREPHTVGLSVLVQDLRHMTAAWDASPWRVLVGAVVRAPFYPALRAMILVRASMWAYSHHLGPLAHLLKARAVHHAGVEVHPGAQVGPGFAFVHTVGIVVGRDVIAGRDLVLHHGVTLGNAGSALGQPLIGDRVRIGAGASVLGPVKVGDGARIGANAVVLADVPPGFTVVGIWDDDASSSVSPDADVRANRD
jgi:serine O-acetyltransferase